MVLTPRCHRSGRAEATCRRVVEFGRGKHVGGEGVVVGVGATNDENSAVREKRGRLAGTGRCHRASRAESAGAAVLAELGEDVAKRRRQGAIGRREGESMRLATPWIWILTQDDRPDAFEGGSTKGFKYLLVWWVDLACLALGRDEALDRFEVVRHQPIAESWTGARPWYGAKYSTI